MTKEEKNEYLRKWRLKNPEKVKERSRKRYSENPEKVNERIRKWRAENPEKVKENKRKWDKKNPEKVLYSDVKKNLKVQIGGIPPPELIEIKITYLKTKRLCKTLKN